MNIKIITLATLGIITCFGRAHAIAINPGGGLEIGGGDLDPTPISTHTCSVDSSCKTNGEINNQQNVTGGQNCASTGTVYLNDYCKDCGYDQKSANTCYKISSCNSCPSGYTRTAKTYQGSSACQQLFLGATYYTCCGACTNCNDSEWTAVSGKLGMQQQTIRTCDCGTCKDSGTRYRCAAGYYGAPLNASGTCTLCPSLGSSDVGDNSFNTKCYITSGRDLTGDYAYDPKCYYQL